MLKCNNDYSVQNDESLRGHSLYKCEKSKKAGYESEKRCDLTRQQREGSSDARWKTIPRTSGCDRKRSVTDSGQTSTSNVQRR